MFTVEGPSPAVENAIGRRCDVDSVAVRRLDLATVVRYRSRRNLPPINGYDLQTLLKCPSGEQTVRLKSLNENHSRHRQQSAVIAINFRDVDSDCHTAAAIRACSIAKCARLAAAVGRPLVTDRRALSQLRNVIVEGSRTVHVRRRSRTSTIPEADADNSIYKPLQPTICSNRTRQRPDFLPHQLDEHEHIRSPAAHVTQRLVATRQRHGDGLGRRPAVHPLASKQSNASK
jgi:hypothetical protein